MTFRNISVVMSADTTSLRSGLTRAASEVDRFQNKVNAGNAKATSGAKLLGAGFLAAGTAVAVGLGYAVVKAAAFEKSMRNVNSLTGASEKQFAAMEKQVISMSTRLPQSAQTLADGLYEIASSGFQGAEGMQVLEASATAASAGLTDTDTAARAITATLNAYGLSASSAGDVSDTLFQTVNLGVISFGELSGVIGDVVGTAAAASVSIDQVGAAIATMTLSGISGAEAGTSLNRVLQSIIQPSASLTDMLKNLGYESGAQALESDGLAGVMEKLRVATGGNITTLLKLFPEIRAARGALALMANEGQNYTRVSAGIEDADARHGATLKVLHEQMKAASNQFQLFKNKVDAIAISTGVHLLPAMVGLMTAAGSLGSGLGHLLTDASALGPVWSDLADTGQNLWKIVEGLWAAIGPLVIAFAKLAGMPVVAALRLTADALADLTGLAANHREILIALITAYAIFNAEALAVGAIRLYSTVVVGLIGGLGRLLGATEAAAGGFRALQVSQVAATAGVGLIVGGLVTGWMKYRDVQQQVSSAVSATADAIAQGSTSALDKQKAALESTRASLEKTITSYTNASFIGRFWKTFNGDAAAAVAASSNLDDIDASLKKVDVSSQKAGENIARFLTETMSENALSNLAQDGEAYRAKVQEIGNAVAAAGGQVSGGYAQMKAALTSYTASHDPAVVAEKQLIAAMGDLGSATDTAQSAVDGLKTALDELVGGPLSQDEALIKWEDALDGMTESIKKNGKTLSVHTAAGRANRTSIINATKALVDRLGVDAKAGVSAEVLAKHLKNGTKRIQDSGAAAGITKKQMKELTTQYGLTPELVETVVRAAGATQSKSQVEALQHQIDALHGKQVNISAMVKYFTSGPPPPGVGTGIGVLKQAEGGVTLPKNAAMARNGANLVQWAEPGTGGEAFIPLGAAKRQRSTALLEQVAQMFGFSLEQYAAGGKRGKHRPPPINMNPRTASALRTSSSQISGRAGGDAASLAAAAAAMDRLNAAYQYNQSLVGLNAGQRKKAANEHKAAATQESVATRLNLAQNQAAYKFDHLSAAAQIKNIDARLKHEKKYSDEWMSLQAQRAQIVADQQAAAQRLADNQRDWNFEHMTQQQQIATLNQRMSAAKPYSDEWMDAAHQREAILKDIADAERAATEAAAEHAQQLLDNKAAWEFDHMSATQQVADLDLRIAKTERYSDEWLSLMRQREDLTRDPNREEALALAGVLQATPGLGILGLSRASGKDVADVVGLLERFWGDIFAPLGGAVSQVMADRAAIEKGRQPSGMARGGIVGSGQTGLHYRWAEPGTGGESLIPLGNANRARARDIWSETGRMLGIRPTGPAGSGGVVVAPGAVRVDLSLSGTNITPEQVSRLAEQAMNKGVTDLVRLLKQGVR